MHWYLYVLLVVKLLVLYFFLKKRVNPSPEVEKRFESRPYAHADTDKWQQWIENPSTFKQLLKSTAAERTGHVKLLAEAQRFLNNSPNIRESNSANPSK